MNLNKSLVLVTMSAALGSLGTLALVSGAGCGGGSGEQPLAIVNGQTISQKDFSDYLKQKSRVRVIVNNGVTELPVADTLAFQGLQDLIANTLLKQYATDQGVLPTAKEIADELEFRKKLRPNFVIELTSLGQTLEDIREALSLDLAKEKLVTKGITVTAEEAEKFVKDNPKEFTTPASVKMLGILVANDADKAKVDADLGTGQSFSSVAVRYSKFPNAAQAGGDVGERAIAQLPEELKKVVDVTPPSRSTAWVKLQEGWAKFFINEKKPEKPMVLDASQKELLRRRLAVQRGSAGVDLDKRLVEKLKESKVDVKDKSLQTAWKSAYDRFIKDSKVNVGAPEVGGNTPTPEGQ